METNGYRIQLYLHYVAVCILLAGMCAAQDPLPANMYNNAMATMQESMGTAMRMLQDTLLAESSTGHSHRQFGRRGAKSMSFKFVQGFLGSTPYGKHLSYPSYVQLKTMAITRVRHGMSNAQVESMMGRMPQLLQPSPYTIGPDGLPPRPRPDQCPYASSVMCDASAPWRTYDGRCNNLRNPLWGASHQPLSRFLPPQYADALEAPRVAVNGNQLPSARLVSSTLHWDFDIPHPIHTLMLMQVGQFVDHDMSRTAISKLTMDPSGEGDDLADVECGEDGCQTEGLENQACLPIPAPFNDTDFGGQNCLMFVRSQEVPNIQCRAGPREQLNQLTSHLDASHVYGSTAKEAFELRDSQSPRRGRLVMRKHPAGFAYKDMLPADPGFKDCRGNNVTRQCFRAGDGRVNEFIGITTQHTMWAREHNRIEGILMQLNPHWDGERLFQETRKIITGLWQNVIYAEYLPLILGANVMQRFELNTQTNGYWNGYNENVNPSVANSFATAAMRFGHSQIQEMLKLMGPHRQIMPDIPISFLFRQPMLMYESPERGCDAILRGLMTQPSQSVNGFITKQVTKHLFSERPPRGLGEDLAALNIQRGRDHGLPGYNSYRAWCGLPRAAQFEDLSREFPAPVISRFKRLYQHVDDIDLFSGGISEMPFPGSLLGPTFSCILASQFRNIKFGDRYWFENRQHNPSPFSLPQLKELKQFSLAGLICNNADTIKETQPNILLQPLSHVEQSPTYSETMFRFGQLYSNGPNERVSCEFIKQMDFSAWRETVAAPPPHPQPVQFAPHANSLPRGLPVPHPQGPPPPAPSSMTVRRNGVRLRVSSAGVPVRFAVSQNGLHRPARTHRRRLIQRSSEQPPVGGQRQFRVQMNLRKSINRKRQLFDLVNEFSAPDKDEYADLLTSV